MPLTLWPLTLLPLTLWPLALWPLTLWPLALSHRPVQYSISSMKPDKCHDCISGKGQGGPDPVAPDPVAPDSLALTLWPLTLGPLTLWPLALWPLALSHRPVQYSISSMKPDKCHDCISGLIKVLEVQLERVSSLKVRTSRSDMRSMILCRMH
ncbi:hypothetical protein EYF80_059657 [Liparis tanakae]|uniref:Uncharacterized protein n=1 Tax=Liparis tanakae TaxID=230148 RepID=A0A4Z2EP97_9TELE|nr:hypothetical protein EYF80_059657 [Liparis tanakae]